MLTRCQSRQLPQKPHTGPLVFSAGGFVFGQWKHLQTIVLFDKSVQCLLYPQKRTFAAHQRLSAKCQKRTLKGSIERREMRMLLICQSFRNLLLAGDAQRSCYRNSGHP